MSRLRDFTTKRFWREILGEGWVDRTGPRAFALAAALALVALYLYGAWRHGSYINTVWDTKDQSPYLRQAKDWAEGLRPNDGARGPGYFALCSLIWSKGLSKGEFFARAKDFNVWLSLGGLAILAVAFRLALSRVTAIVLTIVVAFTCVLFYAPYVKAEALYYAIFAASFVLGNVALERVSWRAALGAGALLGVAHLLKPATLPLVATFTLATVAAVAAEALLRKHTARPSHSLARRVACLSVFLGSFATVTSPYLAQNAQRFGHSTYNVNTSFYIYYDNWGEVQHGTAGHGDRQGWPDLAPKDIPSWSWYRKTHPWSEIRARLEKGVTKDLENASEAWGFLRYACIGVFLLVLAVAVTKRPVLRAVLRSPGPLVFSATTIVGLGVGCVWFYSVHPGLRFMLIVYPLVLFAAAYGIEHLACASQGLTGYLRKLPAPRLWLPLSFGLMLVYDIPAIVMQLVTTQVSAGW